MLMVCPVIVPPTVLMQLTLNSHSTLYLFGSIPCIVMVYSPTALSSDVSTLILLLAALKVMKEGSDCSDRPEGKVAVNEYVKENEEVSEHGSC